MRFGTFLLLLLAGTVAFWPGTGRKWVEIQVGEGQTAAQVARQLVDAGAVRSRIPFLLWTKVRRAGPRIQIGRYRISAGRSSYWILDDLIQGRTEKEKLVIPEGFASWQIAERLESLKICDAKAFLAHVAKEKLEGYLFPATYELANGLSPASVARQLTAEFESRWTPDKEARAKEIGMTKAQVVTLASIVEREVRAKEEYPLVSAVYHNRLKKNMRLEADPTVQFALGYWKSRLTYNDYRNTNSPYNTYLNFGLPPGPICSPGEEAIKGTLWPATTPALFFLAQEDGRHTFSTTYREHTNKVNKRNRTRK